MCFGATTSRFTPSTCSPIRLCARGSRATRTGRRSRSSISAVLSSGGCATCAGVHRTARAALVVFNAGNNRRIDFRELSPQLFEEFWRVGCFGGFLVGREAARRLVPLGRGTVIFTGASASLRGKPGFAHFAAAKAGLRMIAQSMAREYGPLGIHVAHVVIDGGIDGERLRSRRPEIVEERGEDGLLGIEAIAEAYWQIYPQPRSASPHVLDMVPIKQWDQR